MPERKPGYLCSIGVRDITNRLPREQIFDHTQLELPNLYICALGFEARSTALSKVLGKQWLSASINATSLVGEYRTNGQDNETNKPELLNGLQSFSKEVVTTDADSPSKIHESISNLIKSLAEPHTKPLKVIFDISGSSANFILSVMYSLTQHSDLVDLTIVYAEAGEYHPRKELWENSQDDCVSQACDFGDHGTFLECGVETPERNELYPGFYHDARPDFVIAIPGYRTQRLIRCISSIGEQLLANPHQSIFWIFGSPPSVDRSWRLEFQRKMLIRMFNEFSGSQIAENSELFDSANFKDCSTMDYRETLACMLEITDKHLGYRISVVPMGSKFQTIGLAFALAVREEVGVTIARPSKFNPDIYSESVGPIYMLKLGLLSETIEKLKRVGQMKFQTTSGEFGMEQPSI